MQLWPHCFFSWLKISLAQRPNPNRSLVSSDISANALSQAITCCRSVDGPRWRSLSLSRAWCSLTFTWNMCQCADASNFARANSVSLLTCGHPFASSSRYACSIFSCTCRGTHFIPPHVVRAGIPSRNACRNPPQSKSKIRSFPSFRINPPRPFWSPCPKVKNRSGCSSTALVVRAISASISCLGTTETLSHTLL